LKFIHRRFGLDWELFAVKLMDFDQCENVRNKPTCRKLNKKMVDTVIKKTEAERVKLLDALSKNWQQNVVKYFI